MAKQIVIGERALISVQRRHPWVFSGGIEQKPGDIEPGEIVRLVDSRKNFLAWGYHNQHSQISIRILDWDKNAVIQKEWIVKRLRLAVERRKGIASTGTDAYRLVHGEADQLPGLIVDKYGPYICVQFNTAGIERMRKWIVQGLIEILNPSGITEKNDFEMRKLENLPQKNDLVHRSVPPDLTIRENDVKFKVDLREGQKTGFYLDQRMNRRRVSAFAAGRSVLDCFSYTAAFGINCLKMKASSVLRLDASEKSLELGRQNCELNGLKPELTPSVCGDAFTLLRKFRDERKTFDMVVMDPPKLAPTKAHAEKAMRGYKDLNLLAMKLLNPGGILATFSCSSGIDAGTLRNVLLWSSQDAHRDVQVLEVLGQPEDHPSLLAFAESEYLKGFVCRVL